MTGVGGNEGGIGFDWGDFQKNHGMGGHPPPTMPPPIIGSPRYSGLWTPAMLGMPIGCWPKHWPFTLFFPNF